MDYDFYFTKITIPRLILSEICQSKKIETDC